MYERDIIKLMSTNKAFMYGFLLPSVIEPSFHQNSFFFPSEDALIVCGLDTMKPYKIGLREEVKLLSRILLPVRTPEQIYHRIRNAKKTKTVSNLIQVGWTIKRRINSTLISRMNFIPVSVLLIPMLIFFLGFLCLWKTSGSFR